MSEEKKKTPRTISRREFLRDAGIVVGGTAVGSAFLLTACGEEKEITKTVTKTDTETVTTTAPGSTITQTQTQTETESVSKFICPVCSEEFDSLNSLKSHFESEHADVGEIVIKSGFIELDEEKCADCARCLMACSAYHHNAVSINMSGIKWQEDNQLNGYRPAKPIFCIQCSFPECYYACPLKDQAMCIDENTGARYINQDNCIGCGTCNIACPFETKRVEPDIKAPIDERKSFKCDLCKDRPEGPVCIEVCDKLALKLVTAEGRL